MPIAVPSAARRARRHSEPVGYGVPRGSRSTRCWVRCPGRSPRCRPRRACPPDAANRVFEAGAPAPDPLPRRPDPRVRSSFGGCLHRTRRNLAPPDTCFPSSAGTPHGTGGGPGAEAPSSIASCPPSRPVARAVWRALGGAPPFRSEFQRSALSSRFRRGLPRPTTNEGKNQEDPRQTRKVSTKTVHSALLKDCGNPRSLPRVHKWCVVLQFGGNASSRPRASRRAAVVERPGRRPRNAREVFCGNPRIHRCGKRVVATWA